MLTGTYLFCAAPLVSAGGFPPCTATGVANVLIGGDSILGTITGGEVYELQIPALPAGSGQEQFIKVDITGGSVAGEPVVGGSYVIHTVSNLVTGAIESDFLGTIVC